MRFDSADIYATENPTFPSEPKAYAVERINAYNIPVDGIRVVANGVTFAIHVLRPEETLDFR